MLGGKIKFNQCQDCGCPGARLIIEMNPDNGALRVKCPYCGRVGKTFIYIVPFLAEESWNPYNRENKEGLG